MNLFQQLALSGLAILLVLELIRLRHGALGRRAWMVRSLILAATAAAIARPGLTQDVAEMIGIGRGADVVLYASVLALIGVSFYFYTRTTHLQRQLTAIVRHIAIDGAQQGDPRRQENDDDR